MIKCFDHYLLMIYFQIGFGLNNFYTNNIWHLVTNVIMNRVETETCKCTSKQNITCTYFTSKKTVCIIPRTFSSKTFKTDSPDTNLTHGREKVTYAWRSSTEHRDGCFLDDHPDACKNHVEILYKSFLFSFRISSTTSQAIPCKIHLNKMMMT